MGPDRLSPLDASFLHIEDGVSHMHIASVAIFEGPPPPFADVVDDGRRQARPGAAVPPEGAVRAPSSSGGRCGWTTCTSTSSTTCGTRRCPSPGGESELRKLVGRGHGAAARPLQAALGDLGRRGPRGRALGHVGQDAPRARRRRVGHRPAGGDHGPQPRRGTARAPVAVDAARRAVGRRARRRGAREHGALALRAAAGGPGADPRLVRQAAATSARWRAASSR